MSNNQKLKVYRLDDRGEYWWVVAYSAEDALEIGKTMDVMDVDDEPVIATEMPMDRELTVRFIDGLDPNDKVPATPYRADNGYWTVTATILEWLSVHKHGDVIASTLY